MMIHTHRVHTPLDIATLKLNAAALYGAAAVLLVALALPWWQISMVAPQYPYGLHVTTWFFALAGDVREVDELNHYIGFMPLGSIAALERHLAFAAGPLALMLLAACSAIRSRAGALLAVPAIMLPAVFVIDLAAWLRYAGHHLDPHAALSGAVMPWTPVLFGAGGVGQFHTESIFEPGFYFALLAAAAAIAAIVLQFKERRGA
jgi:copper chaperone NosL